jgi:hypothetical protein
MGLTYRALAVVGSAVVGFSLGALTSGSSVVASPHATPPAIPTRREVEPPHGDLVAQALSCSGRNATLADFARLSEFIARFTPDQMGRYLTKLRATADDELTQTAWLFSRWQQVDRPAADRWMARSVLEAAQDGPLYPHDYRPSLFAQWARRDPEAALAAAERYPWSSMAPALIFSAFEVWHDDDPAQQVAFLEKFPPGAPRRKALESHLRLWAWKDGHAALAAADALQDPAERMQCIQAALQNFAEKEPTLALESYRAFQLNNPQLLSEIVSYAANKDGAQTLEGLKHLPPEDRKRCAPIVVARWTGNDPATALSWALQSGVSLSENGYATNVFNTDSMQITERSPAPAYSPALSAAFQSNPAAALAWLQQLPPGSDRDAIYQLAVTATPDRAQALDLFSQLPAASAAAVAESLAQSFRDDLEGGCAWAASLPAGPARAAAWQGIGSAASTPIDLPPGPDRDAMLYGRLFASGEKLAEKSLEITTQISDPTRRRDAFDEVMEMYTAGIFPGQVDKAREWMENSSALPEAWKIPWRK